MLLTIIVFIITLLVLVVVHEFGHFLMAKKFGIKVLEFGFGIPPKVWSKKVGETEVSLNWLPIGGFVRLLGEDETGLVSLKKGLSGRDFREKPVGQKIVVVIAGAVMNLLLAWLIFYLVLGFQGFKVQLPALVPYHFVGATQSDENIIVVAGIEQNAPASQAGIKMGDLVTAINNQKVTSADELIKKTKELSGQVIKLTLASTPQGANSHEVNVTPRVNPPAGQGPLGIKLSQIILTNVEYQTLDQKILAGPLHSWNLIAYSGIIFGDLINKSFQEKNLTPVSQSVSGPVGITSVANTILTQTPNPILPYLDFVGVLSLNLAVLNLLPFPALDGGRLFFLLIEAITRKKVHAEVEKWVHTVGMAILLTLIILVTFSDIRKLFS